MDTNEYSTKKMRLATLTAVAIIITVAAVVAVSIIPFVSIYSSTVESDAGMDPYRRNGGQTAEHMQRGQEERGHH